MDVQFNRGGIEMTKLKTLKDLTYKLQDSQENQTEDEGVQVNILKEEAIKEIELFEELYWKDNKGKTTIEEAMFLRKLGAEDMLRNKSIQLYIKWKNNLKEEDLK